MKKGRIGRKPKGKMQGSVKYVTKTPYQERTQGRKRNATCPPEDHHVRPNKKSSLRTRSLALRYCIYYHYVNVLDAPHEEHWMGVDGTISNISRSLNLRISQNKTVKRVLVEIVKCFELGVEFDGTYQSESN